MKVSVICPVKLDNKSYLYRVLDYVQKETSRISQIIIGNKAISDLYALDYGFSTGIEVLVKKQDRARFGTKAAFLNDLEVMAEGEQVVFVWDGEDDVILNLIKESKLLHKGILIFPTWGGTLSIWPKGKRDLQKIQLNKRIFDLGIPQEAIFLSGH